MVQEPPSRAWIGCLGAAAVIIAAIIGLGVPFAEKMSDVYFPVPTTSPVVVYVTQVVEEPKAFVSTQIAPTANNEPTNSLVPTLPAPEPEKQLGNTIDPTPIREHFPVTVGDGLFSSATFSDGLAPYSEQWLWDNNHHNIQRIRQEEFPDGCDIARFSASKVWISGSRGMQFTVNDAVVGVYDAADFSHGYIVSFDVHMGDKLCAVGFKPIGYSIIIGPDVYYHYDSYCYRGHC